MTILFINKFNRCRHNQFVLDESLSMVKCKQCGEELTPMWVLCQLSGKESRFNKSIIKLNQLADKAKEKNRCKCEHCEKMTRIEKG